LSEERVDVRELTLTGLGPEGHEAKLTLTDGHLIVEAVEEAPLPSWLRGEIPFDGLDIVYVDPAKQRGEEEDEEERLKPGFRITRVIEITNEEANESFPRTAALILDGVHLDLAQAEPFAATFARLAGREKPEEEKADEAAAEEAAPAEAVEAPAPELEAEAEAPAFAAPEGEPAEPEEKAFV
jgi:hypothetical protein